MDALITTYFLIGIILIGVGVMLVVEFKLDHIKNFFLHPFVFSLATFFGVLYLITHQ